MDVDLGIGEGYIDAAEGFRSIAGINGLDDHVFRIQPLRQCGFHICTSFKVKVELTSAKGPS